MRPAAKGRTGGDQKLVIKFVWPYVIMYNELTQVQMQGLLYSSACVRDLLVMCVAESCAIFVGVLTCSLMASKEASISINSLPGSVPVSPVQ